MSDLRTERTRLAIREAFLALRAKKSLERITVKELAEQANINKATFYLHYRDIYDLSEQTENAVIRSIVGELHGSGLFLEDPSRFVRGLIAACEPHVETIAVIFSGSRAAILPDKIEAGLKEVIFREAPQFAGDLYADVLLSYVIQGAYRAYIEHGGRDRLEVLSMVAEISRNITASYWERHPGEPDAT